MELEQNQEGCSELENMGSLLSKNTNDGDSGAVEQVEADAEKRSNKKKRQRSQKPRAEGRPYKRTSSEVISDKITRMQQQKKVLECKLTLLQERLTKHEQEMRIRSEEQGSNEP